ncbi:hypothetical protein P171DRAFT_467470 [Karstenula rhodostoma CBS 690.94]|uniref:Uncharacterized protein n=1 Tax=Karstenula rhodostoma CBS 690.94 TaxID=1392251 RepID=A0A9P4P5Q6_9PLEO|nr:hypothetical protein P171DRAFT_467470 [Karstenula rhodostoma CBS 690.94]
MSKNEETQHVPTTNKDEEKEESKGSGGLLAPLGDPLGKALGTGLRPLGAPLEKGITGPLGNALGGTTRGALGPLLGEKEERSEVLGGDNVDSYSKKESLGGKEQTGQNPLGLDQTGRWGFQDDEEKK